MNKENLLRYIDEKANIIEKAFEEVLNLLEDQVFTSDNQQAAINYVANRLKNKEIDWRLMRDEIEDIEL